MTLGLNIYEGSAAFTGHSSTPHHILLLAVPLHSLQTKWTYLAPSHWREVMEKILYRINRRKNFTAVWQIQSSRWTGGGGTCWDSSTWKAKIGQLWVQGLSNINSQFKVVLSYIARFCFSNNMRTMSVCFKPDEEKRCAMRSLGMIPKACSHAKSWKWLWDLSSVFGVHSQVLVWGESHGTFFPGFTHLWGEEKLEASPGAFLTLQNTVSDFHWWDPRQSLLKTKQKQKQFLSGALISREEKGAPNKTQPTYQSVEGKGKVQ